MVPPPAGDDDYSPGFTGFDDFVSCASLRSDASALPLLTSSYVCRCVGIQAPMRMSFVEAKSVSQADPSMTVVWSGPCFEPLLWGSESKGNVSL